MEQQTPTTARHWSWGDPSDKILATLDTIAQQRLQEKQIKIQGAGALLQSANLLNMMNMNKALNLQGDADNKINQIDSKSSNINSWIQSDEYLALRKASGVDDNRLGAGEIDPLLREITVEVDEDQPHISYIKSKDKKKLYATYNAKTNVLNQNKEFRDQRPATWNPDYIGYIAIGSTPVVTRKTLDRLSKEKLDIENTLGKNLGSGSGETAGSMGNVWSFINKLLGGL